VDEGKVDEGKVDEGKEGQCVRAANGPLEPEERAETHRPVDDDSVPPHPLFLVVAPLALELVLAHRARLVAERAAVRRRRRRRHGHLELAQRGAIDRRGASCCCGGGRRSGT